VWGLRVLVVFAGTLPWALSLLGLHHPAIERVFATLCHQQAERSLVLQGEPMLICSRCAGLYAGFALGMLLPLPRAWLPWGRALLLVSLALLAVDSLGHSLDFWPAWHPSRLGTGLAVGWTVSAFAARALSRETEA
jgi:uncharacterized membrane protein